MVGILNTAFGYSAFVLLVLCGAWPGAALVIATVAGVLFNFQTSRRLVFGADGRLLRFFGVYCVVFVLNWTALRELMVFGLRELEAQALLALPVAAVSFLGQRAFVFRVKAAPV